MQFLVGQFGDPLLAARHGEVGEFLLALYHRIYAFFDGVLGHQPMHHDSPALSDPVGTVGRLTFDRGVPPQVIVDHLAGGGQVEPGAAGLERDQHGARPAL